MTKTLTITLSDAQYEVLQAAAAEAQQSPEALAEATVSERFNESNLPAPKGTKAGARR